MARAPKSTAAEKERRIELIVQMLSEGMPRRMVHAEITKKFGVAPDTVDTYMAEARQRLVAQFRESREEFVANQMAALEHLAHLATTGKQYSAAAGARATMARMVGVDAPRTNNGSK